MSESQLSRPNGQGTSLGQGPSQRHDIGTLVGNRYRLEALIGHGGMASVYKARDESLGRTVALKVFRSAVAGDEDVRRRHEEMITLAGLNHFGLVTLFDALSTEEPESNERAYLVMEYVEGDDLRTRLMSGALDPHSVALIGADIAEALDYVHERGVVHRDVKPGNILLPTPSDTHQAHAKLADFGIARIIDGTRITMTGSVLGTASYLSPEQAAGGALGPATDVYSLGLVLLESLTGSRVFPGSGLESAAARLGRDPVIPSELGPAWQQLLRRMTGRDPEDRPRASEVAERLHALATAPDHADDETRVLVATPNHTTKVLGTEVLGTDVLSDENVVGDGDGAEQSWSQAGAGTGTRPRREGRAAPTRRTRTIAGILAVGAATVLSAAVFLGLSASDPTPTELPIQKYPPVEGDLGEHLKQLQRSVEP